MNVSVCISGLYLSSIDLLYGYMLPNTLSLQNGWLPQFERNDLDIILGPCQGTLKFVKVSLLQNCVLQGPPGTHYITGKIQ